MKGLFLGAGASYELGMPLVTELSAIFRRDHFPEIVREASISLQWSSDAADTLIELLADEELHYEAIIGAFEVMGQRRGPPANSYDGIRKHLVDMVYRYLISQHSQKKKFTLQGLKYLEGLRRFSNKDEPLRIFSLNHDLMVEEICSSIGLPLKAGFHPKSEYCASCFDGAKIDYEFEVITEQQMADGQYDFFQPGEFGVNLYKLHGALDTFLFRDCKDYIRFTPRQTHLGEHIQHIVDIHNASHKLEVEDGVRMVGLLTLKDSRGDVQFFDRSLITGAFKFQRQGGERKNGLAVMFERFMSDIYFVTELTCIGYGFGDLHVNEVLAKWLCSSSDNKLTIVDPFMRCLPGFMLHLKPQIRVVNETFLEFVSAPSVDTLEKRLALHIHQQIREFGRKEHFKK